MLPLWATVRIGYLIVAGKGGAEFDPVLGLVTPSRFNRSSSVANVTKFSFAIE